MKTLTLIRHAKSSWADPGQSDVDRPLNKRGKRDAPVMGRRLAGYRLGIQRILTSPAERAWTTARILADALSYTQEDIELEDRIYEASAENLLEVIRSLPEEVDRAALCGHNPGFTDLANLLTGGAIENIPTCGILHLELPVDSWPRVSPGSGKVVFFDCPKRVSA